MIVSPTSTAIITVNNSITNTLDDEKLDTNKPFSFIEFLNYTKSLDKSPVSFIDYQKYLKAWNTATYTSYTDLNTLIKEQFIEFLKTISLNYTTAEERRYLSSIDYNNPDDLEIAVPFFVQKIKQIILYYAEKRDTYRIDYELSKNKGTVTGVSSYLKNSIIETLFGNDSNVQIKTDQSLTDLSQILKIEVEESYDIFNDYYDLDPSKPPEFYDAINLRKTYFTSNTNPVDPNLFIDFDQAIINQINSEGVVLEALKYLAVNINTPTLEYLQPYDFDDYSTQTRSNLRLIFDAELAQKFTGTDMYYLSTNSIGEVLSGRLFEATSPFANLINIYSPSTLTVPQGISFYDREVGLFFKPSRQSILKLQTPFTFTQKENIKPDNVYVFPDPSSYGNVSGVSKVDHDSPLIFSQQGQLIQKNVSSNIAIGHSYVTKNDLTFESYHSAEQVSNTNILNFVYNTGIVTNYVSDLYGNVIIGFKETTKNYLPRFVTLAETYNDTGSGVYSNIPYLSSIKTLLATSLTGTQTTSFTPPSLMGNDKQSIYANRTYPGNFYIYNAGKDLFTNLNVEFANVFQKFPTVSYQIQNQLRSVEIYGNTYVFTTSSIKVIDDIRYDIDFYSSSDVPLILSSTPTNNYSNVFLVGTDLFVARYYEVNDQYLNFNTCSFALEMLSYSVAENNYKTYSFYTTNENVARFDFDVRVYVTNMLMTYNKLTDTYNVVIELKDSNKNLYIKTFSLVLINGKFKILSDTLYHPTNGNVTLNFYENLTILSLSLNTILTTPTPDITNGTLTF